MSSSTNPHLRRKQIVVAAAIAGFSVYALTLWHLHGVHEALEPLPPESSSTQQELPAVSTADPADAKATAKPHVAPAWYFVGDVAADQMPAYKEEVKDAVAVRLVDGLSTKTVGDRIALSIPQKNALYSPIIEAVDYDTAGNVAYTGRLLEDGVATGFFVLTVAREHTFAFLKTPVGTFELVGNRTYAWLMPQENMDQHVDYSKPDYIVADTHQYKPISEMPGYVNDQ